MGALLRMRYWDPRSCVRVRWWGVRGGVRESGRGSESGRQRGVVFFGALRGLGVMVYSCIVVLLSGCSHPSSKCE